MLSTTVSKHCTPLQDIEINITMNNPPVIDMSAFKFRIYMGRDKGALSRTHFKLTEMEDNHSLILVYFPDNTNTILSSFFLAMFGDSVRSLGKDKFCEKYTFKATEHIKESINHYIQVAENSH
jgi:hypothetical protein